MPLTRFGPFAAVFERGELLVPGHLELLHLNRPGAQIVVDRVERARAVGDPARWLDALLGDSNWRPHLVGAVALLLDEGETANPEPLWRAVDRDSWVTPQLVVTAMFVDRRFPEEVQRRVSPWRLEDGHRATGTEGVYPRSPKLLASLMAASAAIPGLTDWRTSLQRDPHIQELLEADTWNNSGAIVEAWRSNVERVFRERGRVLTPLAT